MVTVLLVRQSFLDINENYKQVTDFILNSEDEQIYKVKGQMKNLHV